MLSRIKTQKRVFWINPNLGNTADVLPTLPLGFSDVEQADYLWDRARLLLKNLFPELESTQGIIESPLCRVPEIRAMLLPENIKGDLFIKADNYLPIAGSIKARGGIYAVLVIAEKIAIAEGLIEAGDDFDLFATDEGRTLFAQHAISVGSTGNLGLSIGIIASTLGFKCIVHMSHDAKEWKKNKLRDNGVRVIEHKGDYASAVLAARQQAAGDSRNHFIDDENSKDLFLGYGVAALRLAVQFSIANVTIDEDHPLFVYLPCGVGGAPGGITFALKQLFGDHVHCFFAEPTASPCMLTRLAYGKDKYASVYDLGLDNKTEADGLAVATASELVAPMMEKLVSGCYTVEDEGLLTWLYLIHKNAEMKVEPSAAVGLAGPSLFLKSPEGQAYIEKHNLQDKVVNSVHVIWLTGGEMLPDEEFEPLRLRGRETVRDLLEETYLL